MESDSDYESEAIDYQLQDSELDSTQVYNSEETLDIQKDYPYPFSYPMVDQVNDDPMVDKVNDYPMVDQVNNYPMLDQVNDYPMVDQVNDYKLDMDTEHSACAGLASGPWPVSKKLPVRRQIKSENEMDESLTNGFPFDPPAHYAGNNSNSNPVGEPVTPVVQWDVSKTEDNMMFDIGDLETEFEPQTYFSFNELLASDDGVKTEIGDQNPY
ncbi:uncharacterized protein [Rutidosis leptorrhynchoides]|uniref:uncharacterized protein n=1 Tax=Rutidosis leptorrhynchoides TaxID=125765 RepID=UPI003A99FABF